MWRAGGFWDTICWKRFLKASTSKKKFQNEQVAKTAKAYAKQLQTRAVA